MEPRPRLVVLCHFRALSGDAETAVVAAVATGSPRRRCNMVPPVVLLLLHSSGRGGLTLYHGREFYLPHPCSLLHDNRSSVGSMKGLSALLFGCLEPLTRDLFRRPVSLRGRGPPSLRPHGAPFWRAGPQRPPPGPRADPRSGLPGGLGQAGVPRLQHLTFLGPGSTAICQFKKSNN